jgi:two-component system, OmpR family, alkaline phosphatase synthesis response regulator PhoP
LPPDASPAALIVGPDEHTAFLLEFMLQREGFGVTSFPEGAAAADYVAREAPADVVVTDVVMPFVDGFELVSRIRADDRWRRVPVIVLSAHSADQEVIRALELGANDYITKPFNAGVLLARIRRHMQAASGERP